MAWRIIPNDPTLEGKPYRLMARTIAEDGGYPQWRVRVVPHRYSDGTVTGLRVLTEARASADTSWYDREGNLPWALMRHLPALLAEFESYFHPEGQKYALSPLQSAAFGEGSVQQLFPFLDPTGTGPVFETEHQVEFSDPPTEPDPLAVFDSLRDAALMLEPSPERERTLDHIERIRRQSATNIGVNLDDED